MASEQPAQNELVRMVEVFWRRKIVILVPFFVIFIMVTLWGLYQPNIYRSTSSIFIESQKVPTDYVRSTVTTDLENRLRTISQQLTSRTKLLKVITEVDLYSEAKAQGLPSEVLVDLMRRNLQVEIPRTGGRSGEANFFYVHFQHKDPTKAMLAVSRLVSLFIEESLQVREQQAKGTTTFIEEELAKLKATLEQQEQAIQSYKGRHMGELPDQLEANLRMLDNLQVQLTNNQESEREMENRLILLEQEVSRLDGERRVAGSVAAQGGTQAMTNTTLNGLFEQREILSQRIASLSTMYTERHPDLVSARKELARLDVTIKSATAGTSSPIPTAGAAPTPATSMEMANLRRQINDTKPRLAALQEEERNLRNQIAQYQQRVESAPEREQNLLKLTRDYENTKASYEDLLSKRQEAQLSENLEKRQQGENFQILDPANFPEKPYLPNRPKIIGLGLAGGLGLGVALALLLEMLHPAFHSLKQLQAVATVPLTLGIPYIESTKEKRRHKRRVMIGFGVGAMAFLLLLLLVHLFILDLGVLARTIGANIKGMI